MKVDGFQRLGTSMAPAGGSENDSPDTIGLDRWYAEEIWIAYSVEKKPISAVVATSSGGLGFDVSLKAPESECISFSVPVALDEKKDMVINKMVINKKEMVTKIFEGMLEN
ncbi:hypothetical protein L1987_48739 [Smallanthus sonchifolius]|uniref:Uncharacterized protein n=1 Tax=Smallanthus sonchifolius TaxID=185202 RepID=A0ACB9FSI9_9ASTR|nr:hypothetical protein L1987_48739 [Smallanthus sonchifolius]